MTVSQGQGQGEFLGLFTSVTHHQVHIRVSIAILTDF